MARQKELPGTRRDDEPRPPPSIKELDDACDLIRKQSRRVTRANQDKVAAVKAAQELLAKHNLTWYPYEDGEVKRKITIEPKLKDVKVKTEKRGDAHETDDGDEE